jgi:hypothetical protein
LNNGVFVLGTLGVPADNPTGHIDVYGISVYSEHSPEGQERNRMGGAFLPDNGEIS